MQDWRRLAMIVAIFSLSIGIGVGYRRQSEYLSVVQQERYLHVLAIDGVLGRDLTDEFKRRSRVGVLLDTIVTSTKMRAALEQNLDDYDVVICDLSHTTELRRQGRLAVLLPQQIPNLNSIALDFQRDPSSPQQILFAPMLWGINGILVNTAKTAVPTSLAQMLGNKALRKKIAWSKDPADIRQLLTSRRGFTRAIENEEGVETVRHLVSELTDFVVFYNELPTDQFLAETYWIMEASNGQAAFSRSAHATFAWPSEGAPLWMMGAAIPERSRHKKWAEQFINFMLEPAAAQKIVQKTHQATTLKAAWEGLPPMAQASYLKQIPLSQISYDDSDTPSPVSDSELEKWITQLKSP